LRDSLVEGFCETGELAHLDNALEFPSRRQAERRGDDDAEEPIAADNEREELRVLATRAALTLTGRADQRQLLQVGDERRHRQPASVCVRRDCTAEREAICPGLLLADRPRRLAQVREEGWPLNPSLDRNPALVRVVLAYAIEPSGVDQDPAGAELLATHRVAASGDTDRKPCLSRAANDLLDILNGGHLDDLANLGAVQPRMDVVDHGQVRHSVCMPRRWCAKGRSWGGAVSGCDAVRGYECAC